MGTQWAEPWVYPIVFFLHAPHLQTGVVGPAGLLRSTCGARGPRNSVARPEVTWTDDASGIRTRHLTLFAIDDMAASAIFDAACDKTHAHVVIVINSVGRMGGGWAIWLLGKT